MQPSRQSVFDAWAPEESCWSAWAKPVVFATMTIPTPGQILEKQRVVIPTWNWMPERASARDPAAWIIELPGETAVMVGVAMARRGFRPVPLFNAAPPSRSMPSAINQTGMVQCLCAFAEEVRSAGVDPAAPPVFLLDSGRMPTGKPRLGEYDNRWLTFPQDFPSARMLGERGIVRAVVVTEQNARIADDLRHVLRRWQEDGVQLLRQGTHGSEGPEPLEIARPSLFRSSIYRTMAAMGLRRHAAGGFGGVIPEASGGGMA